MCDNNKCTLTGCYRKTAMPNPYNQSYARFEPNNKGVCNFYYKR